jgi:hypothetical protein
MRLRKYEAEETETRYRLPVAGCRGLFSGPPVKCCQLNFGKTGRLKKEAVTESQDAALKLLATGNREPGTGILGT